MPKWELRWDDVNRATEPGPYRFRTGTIVLTRHHISAWEQDPVGVWTVFGLPNGRYARFGLRHFITSVDYQRRTGRKVIDFAHRRRLANGFFAKPGERDVES